MTSVQLDCLMSTVLTSGFLRNVPRLHTSSMEVIARAKFTSLFPRSRTESHAYAQEGGVVATTVL